MTSSMITAFRWTCRHSCDAGTGRWGGRAAIVIAAIVIVVTLSLAGPPAAAIAAGATSAARAASAAGAPSAARAASAAGAPSAVRAAAAACAPQPAANIADVPWPQRRYHQRALDGLADGAGVTVAVVDSGVDARHPQLTGRVRAGADLLDTGTAGWLDCVGHGTAVASIIAAAPVSGAGLRGLAPGALILPIRVSERVETNGTVGGRGTAADVATGIRAAVAFGADVINLSISTTVDHRSLRAAIDLALAADVVVIAAAGNEHDRGDPTPYPAAYPGVVGVGAIGPDGLRVASSQVGSYVDIVAPGDGVVGAAPRGGHSVFQGTSFAAAFVSGTAALIRSHRPQLSRDEVVRQLLMTADPAPGPRPSAEYGYGALNPVRAVTEIVPPPTVNRPHMPISVRRPAPAEEVDPAIPLVPAVGIAIVLGLAAAGVAAVAAAAPLGRRRRWRPGRPAGATARPGRPAGAGPVGRADLDR